MIKHQKIILGRTRSGSLFRPSDWAERLSGTLSCFDNKNLYLDEIGNHLQYSPYAYPTQINSLKSLMIDEKLNQIEPAAYRFIIQFAQENELEMVDACLIDSEVL